MAFAGGLLPVLAMQFYVNHVLSNAPATPGGLTFGRGLSTAAEHAWAKLPLLSTANLPLVFWMPPKVLRLLTQATDLLPWQLCVTLVVFALPVLLVLKNGYSLSSFGDLRVVAAGLFIAVPLILWACMLFGKFDYVGERRYYWPLLPLAVFIFYSLAQPSTRSKSRLTKFIQYSSVIYVTGFVFLSIVWAVYLFLPGARGKDQREKLMGTREFHHWPSMKVNYEFSRARSFLIDLLKENPDTILLTNVENWFYADPTINRSRLHRLEPCQQLGELYLTGPARIVVLARDYREVQPIEFAWTSVTGQRQRAECYEKIPGFQLVKRFPDENLKVLEARIPSETRVALR
jgi:hypothetical protein